MTWRCYWVATAASVGPAVKDLAGADPIYVPVTVRYDGGVWTHVGMRYKGNSSLATAFRTGILKIAPYVVGEEGEQAPYTMLSTPDEFRFALSDPAVGLLNVADGLREAVRAAVAQ